MGQSAQAQVNPMIAPKRTSSQLQCLERNSIFSIMSPQRRSQIERQCCWRRYKPGESIVGYLDTSDDVFIVAAGEVRVSIYSVSGRAVTFADLGPGEIFGEFSAVDGETRSAGIEARTSCVVGSIPSDVFRNILEMEPGVALALLRKLIAMTRKMTARVYEFSVLPVSSRVHSELLRMAQPTRTSGVAAISPAPTNAEIANRISTHREAVSREVKRLSRLGVLERRDGVLWLKDIPRLASMLHAQMAE